LKSFASYKLSGIESLALPFFMIWFLIKNSKSRGLIGGMRIEEENGMKKIERRSFLQTAAVTGALLSAPAVKTFSRTKKYRTAVIGPGWWGLNIARYAMASGQAEIVALCDVDQNADRDLDRVHRDAINNAYDAEKPYLQKAGQLIKALAGNTPNLYTDHREMLKKEKPEIVIIGSPDHWHALHCIDAVEAGAHVYCEKPICHTVLEGQAMVAAARKNNRVVQIGTHRRVAVHNKSAMEFLWAGNAGKIGSVKCFVNYGGGAGRPTPDADIPKGLDWDMFVGPAADTPFNPRIHPKGFRNFLNFGNGTVGDWGVHWFDQVLWWARDEVTPTSISATGGRFINEDNTDTPDTLNCAFTFEDFTCTWENRQYAGNVHLKNTPGVGCFFYGTKGILHLGWRDGWTFYPQGRGEEVHVDAVFDNADHENIKELWADLIESIETGRKPVCDIQYGFNASCMSLLSILSWKIGRSVAWDQKTCTIEGDHEANQLLKRKYRGEWKYPEA
jgi:predicted dehydrogenase